jgi:hypothetical protein
MSVYVEYKFPVLVEVDLDDETIGGVWVDDEQVEGPPTSLHRSPAACRTRKYLGRFRSQRARAGRRGRSASNQRAR